MSGFLRSFFEMPDLSDPCSPAVTAVCGAQKVGDLIRSRCIRLWNTTQTEYSKDSSTDAVENLRKQKLQLLIFTPLKALRVIHGLVEHYWFLGDNSWPEKFSCLPAENASIHKYGRSIRPRFRKDTLQSLSPRLTNPDMGLYLDDSDLYLQVFWFLSERVAYNLAFPNELRN